MTIQNQSTKDIIERYKDELRTIGINPEKVVQGGSYARLNDDDDDENAINLIIVSDDLKHIDICKRLEVLGLAAGRVSERIQVIGFTEKEMRNANTACLKKK